MENPPGCTWGPYTAGWFNEQCYSFPTLWLFFVGCALWAAAYLVIIRNGIRYKFVEMPAIAGAADIAWEFTYSFVHETNMGKMAEYTYHVWFLTDVALAWLLILHGHKQGWSPFMVKHFRPMAVIATLVWFLFFVTYQPSGYTDHYIGAITAYADNVVISACYIFMLASVKDVRAVSPIVGQHGGFIDKFIGDAILALFSDTPDGAVRAAAEMQRALQRLNAARAGVRVLARQRLPGYEARYGTPVNHEDMLGTILGFSLLVIVGMRKLATPLEPAHEAALFYPWQAFAVHMGLPEAWIPRDVADAEACCAAYARRNCAHDPAANPDGVALTAADLGLIEELLPVGCKGLGKTYMWRLLGPEGAARVGLGAPTHGRLEAAALKVGATFLERVRRLAGVGRVVDEADYVLCKTVFQALIGHAYQGEPAIRVPRTLRDLHDL